VTVFFGETPTLMREICRKEASLSTVMSSLRRVELKLDQMASSATASQNQMMPTITTFREQMSQNDVHKFQAIKSPTAISDTLTFDDRVEESATFSPISFSQHQVLFWPAILEIIPNSALEYIHKLRPEYAIELEMDRLPLLLDINPYPHMAGESWLRNLPFSIIRGLSEAYFDIFNPGSPILDSDAYFETILSTVARNGFGYNSESCIVLNVLSLGCLALKTYEEGDFPLSHRHDVSPSNNFQAPEWIDVIREIHPGLRFFNEARKRSGAFMCENSMQSSQFYLLSG
jgi:hypothetical protein